MELASRFFDIPRQSCFLFGPRGTGKSTWLRHKLSDALHIDLLEPSLHRRLSARPERLRDSLAGAPPRVTALGGGERFDSVEELFEGLGI